MAQGYDISECAAAIFIRARYLTAIEDGRFEDLPDQAYVGGFVRAYAEHLGVPLDGFAEPDRELPVRSEASQRLRPIHLTATRTRSKAGRGLVWIVWGALLMVALGLIVLLALWLGVFETPAVGPVS
jgi:cytoskeletal protein RodZ